MTFTLTDDVLNAIDASGDQPVKLVHPVTKRVYLLVSEDRYERLKPLFEDVPMTHEEQRFLLQQAGKRADWDAPEMDAYDHYDEQRPKSTS